MSARVRKQDGRIPSPRRCNGERGFTLMELMVVVLIVAILAVIAIPTMGEARFSRHGYDDAGSIAQLFRAARARAVSRGTAVLVSMTQSGTDRGTFLMFEASATAAQATTTGGGLNTPISTCMSPTIWPPNAGATATLIDGVNMNGQIEAQGGIASVINDDVQPTSNTGIASAFVCFTPLGRAYYSVGTTPAFITGQFMTNDIYIDVKRTTTGNITRRVVLPPTGAARILSF